MFLCKAWDFFSFSLDLDVELQVLVHGVDVVEDVLHDPGDDSHGVCVMEQSLKTRRRSTVIHRTTALIG